LGADVTGDGPARGDADAKVRLAQYLEEFVVELA
jgi:hypothetical protein